MNCKWVHEVNRPEDKIKLFGKNFPTDLRQRIKKYFVS